MKKTLIVFALLIMFIISGCTGNKTSVSPGPVSSKASVNLYPAFTMDGALKKWGYIDDTGKFIITPAYDQAEDFNSNGLALIHVKDKCGLIDKSGKTVLQPEYSYITFDPEGSAIAVKGDNLYSLLDSTGKVVFQNDDIISDVSGGMASFSKKQDNGKLLWGYVNTKGTVVIKPQFSTAENFNNGKALVSDINGSFKIIDLKGTIVKTFHVSGLSDLSEDTVIVSKKTASSDLLKDYISTDGKSITNSSFTYAEPFKDGYAVVCTGKMYENKYGLIDKTGKFVIPPKYGEIAYLGEGLYSAAKPDKDLSLSEYIPKAVFNKTGQKLTDFKYYEINRFDSSHFAVTDDAKTYIIDHTGKQIQSYPALTGKGDITLTGNLIKASATDQLHYYTHNNKLVWKSDDTLVFQNGIKVKTIRYVPNIFMSVSYPLIDGMADKSLQDKLNSSLKKKFMASGMDSEKNGDKYTDDITTSFSAELNKDLLTIYEGGYDYPFGAAHGMPYRSEYFINIKTGKTYTLDDLFKKNSGYKQKLIRIVKDMINDQNNSAGGNLYWDDLSKIGVEGYVIGGSSLNLYYTPYEIAAYAYGFPEFDIPYDKIMSLINTDGELWNSFERKDVNADASQPDEISADTMSGIKAAIDGYENNIVSAINSNDFSLVEPYLYKDGYLYKAQKLLVQKLSSKGTQEKLDSYTLDKVEPDRTGSFYYAYVTENISVKAPDKDYVSKQFKWRYSLVSSVDGKSYQLTYIKK